MSLAGATGIIGTSVGLGVTVGALGLATRVIPGQNAGKKKRVVKRKRVVKKRKVMKKKPRRTMKKKSKSRRRRR